MSIIAEMKRLEPEQRAEFLSWLDDEGLLDIYRFVTTTATVRQFYQTFFSEDRLVQAAFDRQHIAFVRSAFRAARRNSDSPDAAFGHVTLRIAIEAIRKRYDHKLFGIFHQDFRQGRRHHAWQGMLRSLAA